MRKYLTAFLMIALLFIAACSLATLIAMQRMHTANGDTVQRCHTEATAAPLPPLMSPASLQFDR